MVHRFLLGRGDPFRWLEQALAVSPGGDTSDSVVQIRKRRLTLSDGVGLNLLEAGAGAPLLLIPGWSQTAAMFRHQLDGLSDRYRVLALDLRGHGESDKPAHGYRVSRLACDVHEVVEILGFDSLAVLGHSMGNAVLWSHFEIFGRDRFSKLIVAEQPPTLLARPSWSQETRERAGCITDGVELGQNCDSLLGPDPQAFASDFVGSMLSEKVSAADRRFIVEQNLLMPRAAAAALLQATATADWRDLIPRIDLPTLIIAGKASIVPYASQLWIQNQIQGSRLEGFAAEEGGSHFMFWENPAKFNRVVADFLG